MMSVSALPGHVTWPPMAHDTLSRSVTRPHDSRDDTDAGQMLPSQAGPRLPRLKDMSMSVSRPLIGQTGLRPGI